MSNLENLTQKILDDAKKEADLIVLESNRKSEAIISSKVNEANENKLRILEKASTEATMMKDRVVSNAELSARDEKLKAKQDIIDRIFTLSKEQLKNLSEDDFVNVLKNTIKTLSLDESNVLVVPEKFKNKVKSLGLRLSISEDERIESGFLIKNNNIIMNYSFDFLVDYLRDELEGQIAKELFKG